MAEEMVNRKSTFSEKVTVVDIFCNLDMIRAQRLNELIAKLVSQGEYYIIINLEKVNYVNSAGIAAMIGHSKIVKKHGGDIKFININGQVKDILDVFGLHIIFRVLDTEKEAVEEFLKEDTSV